MRTIWALLGILAATAPVLAFDCLSMPGSIREALPDASNPNTAVFTGEVRRLDPVNQLAYIYVLERFTGPAPGTILEIEFGASESIRYTQGRTYLVEAYRTQPSDPWTTSTCSHTRLLSESGSDLAALRAWKKGEWVPCNITGLLWGRDGSERRSGIGVRLFGKDKTFLAITGREGRFEFKGVPAGTYRIMSNGWVPKSIEVTRTRCPLADLFPVDR